MRLSQSFTRTYKDTADTNATNHELLVKAGYVDQLMAGVYSYLPLGLQVLRNIENIIRDEMNLLGAEEVLMPILHPKEPWETTGGWDSIDVLFKLNSRTETQYALGQSEEEIVTPLVMSRVQSYKDLPLQVYQIHWKYRDELRAKSGIMRGREFYMKDMYSFHTDQADFDRFYALAKAAYLRIFSRIGLEAKVTEASGGNFTDKVSYEFMVLTDAGEDMIIYCDSCDYCVNEEIAQVKSGDKCHKCQTGKFSTAKASEVGNVFDLGQKYGRDFKLTYTDEHNQRQFPIMGCYGIGVSRLMGVIVERFHDKKGIIWPAAVAPAAIHLVALHGGESQAESVYENLTAQGISVVYDDRDESAGNKLSTADLLGIPLRVICSAKTAAANGLEVTVRADGQTKMIKPDELNTHIQVYNRQSK